MEIMKETLDNACGRAEEYRLLGQNHPEGLQVHIEYIRDLMKTLVRLGYNPASINEDSNEVFSVAKKTLKNLLRVVAAAKPVAGPAIYQKRVEIVQSCGQDLPLFFGQGPINDFLLYFMHHDFEDTDIVKLIILKSCLESVTFNLVNVLRPSTKNYSLAIQLLTHVYVQHKSDLRQLYHAMVNLPQVSSGDGLDFCRAFWKLENIFQLMQRAGEKLNDNEYLRLLYMRKFSEDTLIGFLVKDSNMSLSDIRAEIRRMVHIQELNCKPSTDNSVSACSATNAAHEVQIDDSDEW